MPLSECSATFVFCMIEAENRMYLPLLCLWGAKIGVATTRPNLQTLTFDLGGYTGKKLAMTRGLFYFFISPPGGQQIYTIYGLSEPVLCLTHLSKLI